MKIVLEQNIELIGIIVTILLLRKWLRIIK